MSNRKPPKAERMYQHIVEDCRASDKEPRTSCEQMATDVVAKWKTREKDKRDKLKTPKTK